MAEWKKIITSGSNAELNQVTSSGISVTNLDATNIGAFTAGGAIDFNDENLTNVDIDSGDIASGVTINKSPAVNFNSGDVQGSITLTNLAGGTGALTIQSGVVEGSMLNSNVVDNETLAISSNALVIKDGGVDSDALAADIAVTSLTSTNITASGNISGSLTSTGSFGHLRVLDLSQPDIKILSSSLSTRITNAEATDGDITRVNITAGNGLGGTQDTTEGDHTQTLSVNAAQTTITSVKHDSLIVGRSGADDTINFTAGDVSIEIGGSEKLGIDTNGIQVTGDAVISGDLTVNGDLTTIATTNTLVEDQLMFLGTGSAGTNKDVGIIAQSGSTDKQGSALYHDTNSERWSVAKSVNNNATAITPLQHVVTVTTSTSTPGAANADYGVGEMWVDTDASEPTGDGVIYIRTA